MGGRTPRRALCAKYGVPYVQESVFTRVRKMWSVAIGPAKMKRMGPVDAMPVAAE